MRILILSATCTLFVACTQGIQSPQTSVELGLKVPSSWKEAGNGNHGKISSGWVKEFKSPRMTKLVNEAIRSNPSLKASEARLRASWQLASVADADLKPSVGSSASGSRRLNGSTTSSFGVNMNASWELDLWGRVRDRVDVNNANYQVDIHDYRNARLSLAANTAKFWCNLITSEQQLELAKNTLASFEKNNRIVERNYKAGIPGTSSLAVQLSRSNVASARSTLRDRQLRRNNSARSLETLLGRYPSAKLKSTTTLPTITRNVPTGVPASLLSRRPDIANAELDVYISAKRSDIARKSLLPAIRFSSSASSGSSDFSNIFNFNNIAANAAANLTQSVYNGGELQAAAKAALERNQAAIHSYTNVVLRAAREVEQAIATDKALREQESFLVQQTKSATLAEAQAERDYSEGIEGVGILEVLESQRRANNARSSLIIIRNRRLQNRIDLHLALGGDFNTAL